MVSMVVMQSVTVELMSAMERRCWKTGFKMEGHVSYFLFSLFIIVRRSTSPLVFGSWELSQVIFLKLRKKEVLPNLSKFTK